MGSLVYDYNSAFSSALQIGGGKNAEESSTYGKQGSSNFSCKFNFLVISSCEAISRYCVEYL